MKESKKTFIIFFIIFLVLPLFAYFRYVDYGDGLKKGLEYHRNFLKDMYTDVCITNIDKFNGNPSKLCEIDVNGIPGSLDTYTIINNILRNTILEYLIFFDFILIIIFSLYGINKLMKSKYLYYYIQRDKYTVFIKEMILNAYKYVLVVPFFMLSLYLLSLTISNHGPNALTLYEGYATFDLINYKTKGFLILFTIYIMIMWLFYINIGLIVQSKNRKFIFTIIECLILYFVLEMIVEKITPYFWIIDIYNPRVYSIYYYIGFSLICFISSFVLVILSYKSKEEILKRVGDE